MHSDSRIIKTDGKQPRFRVSEFESEKPANIAKTFFKDEKGNLACKSGGQIYQGSVSWRMFTSFRAFFEWVKQLPTRCALSYGTCAHRRAHVVTKDDLEGLKDRSEPFVARSKSCFSFTPEWAGILMIDYDPISGEDALSFGELLQALYTVCPALKNAPHMAFPSSSSFIFDGEEEKRGARGWRVLVLIKNVSDVPRATKVLFSRCILKGHISIDIDKAGRRHTKSLIDKCTGEAWRLDFVGGANCRDGLEQRRGGHYHCFNSDSFPLDTETEIPDLNPIESHTFNAAVSKARDGVWAKAQRQKELYAEERACEDLKRHPPAKQTPELKESLKQNYIEVIEGKPLCDEFSIHLQNGNVVTVGEIKQDVPTYDGANCCDPLEPDYRGDNRIARIYLRGKEPHIYSYAHGGQRFILKSKNKITYSEGNLYEIIGKVVVELKRQGNILGYGGKLVLVLNNGGLKALCRDSLLLLLNKLFAWKKYYKRSKTFIPCKAPRDVADQLLASIEVWDFNPLVAVVNVPFFCTKNKRIICESGYHADSGIYLVGNHDQKELSEISLTDSQLESDLNDLWVAFRDFPYKDSVSISVMVAAILTAITRLSLSTSPGFAFDSSSVKAGKTLCAESLSALSGVINPSAYNIAGKDEEIQKFILGSGMINRPAMILDNLNMYLSSNVLCSYLTSEFFSGRLLGTNTIADIPTRKLCLLTGINLRFSEDLTRRIFPVRLELKTEEDSNKEYEVNPKHYCQENRMKIVKAGLRILLAAMKSDYKPKGKTPSFEDWSDCVRTTVCWLGTKDVAESVFKAKLCDPEDAIQKAFANHPELAKLKSVLEAWHAACGESYSTVSAAFSATEDEPCSLELVFRNVLDDQKSDINTQVGRWMGQHAGKPCGGMKIERHPKLLDGKSQWRVVDIEA